MTKLEISRKLPEYYFFRIAENASKSSRKPRKISVNLSEIRRFQEIFINLRAYEGSNGETASRRDPSHRVAESLEHASVGEGVVVRSAYARASGADARRGVERRGVERAVRVGRRRRGGGRPCGGVRGWGGAFGGEVWRGGRRRASRLGVDGGRGVGGRGKPRPTRGRVDGGGVVGMRGV